jgi:UDP-glucose:(heptosyl)LPS alpha-1,3-glucosyltransferase
VIIIPNGFAPEEFNPEVRLARRPTERARLRIKPDDLVLLFVANELVRKGYPTVLNAMKRLGRPEIKLLVVGKANVEAVKRQAVEAGLADQVIACGATGEVAQFHAAADVFVLPTQYEAFCLAILEALGSGLPVITTRIPGAEDAIDPGVNGLLIGDPKSGAQLESAVEQMMDHQFRASLSGNAPKSVRCYQWPTLLARYEDVLRQHTHVYREKGQ